MDFEKLDKNIIDSTINDFCEYADDENLQACLEDVNTILNLKYVDKTLKKQLLEAKQDILDGDVYDVKVDARNISAYLYHIAIANN